MEEWAKDNAEAYSSYIGSQEVRGRMGAILTHMGSILPEPERSAWKRMTQRWIGETDEQYDTAEPK